MNEEANSASSNHKEQVALKCKYPITRAQGRRSLREAARLETQWPQQVRHDLQDPVTQGFCCHSDGGGGAWRPIQSGVLGRGPVSSPSGEGGGDSRPSSFPLVLHRLRSGTRRSCSERDQVPPPELLSLCNLHCDLHYRGSHAEDAGTPWKPRNGVCEGAGVRATGRGAGIGQNRLRRDTGLHAATPGSGTRVPSAAG